MRLAIRDPVLKQQIANDTREANRVNVRGVPCMYINGRSIKSYTIESLSAMIDQQLRNGKQANR